MPEVALEYRLNGLSFYLLRIDYLLEFNESKMSLLLLYLFFNLAASILYCSKIDSILPLSCVFGTYGAMIFLLNFSAICSLKGGRT